MSITEERLKYIVEWLTEKKADAISVYDLTKANSYTDYIVVCEGQADQHVRAMGNYLLEMAKSSHISALSKEGLDYAHWVLLDFGDVIVHIFIPETRTYYMIDEFFKSCLQKLEAVESSEAVESNND